MTSKKIKMKYFQRREVNFFLKNSKRYYSNSYIVFYMPFIKKVLNLTNENRIQFAFVSKSKLKRNSIKRNKQKRRFRAIFYYFIKNYCNLIHESYKPIKVIIIENRINFFNYCDMKKKLINELIFIYGIKKY